MSKYLFEGYYWSLTPECEHVLDELESQGIDRDFAFSLLEKICANDQIYQLPAE